MFISKSHDDRLKEHAELLNTSVTKLVNDIIFPDYWRGLDLDPKARQKMRLIDQGIRADARLKDLMKDTDENALFDELLGRIQSHLQYVQFAKYPDQWLRAIKDDLVKGTLPDDLFAWLQDKEPTPPGREELILKCYRRVKAFEEQNELKRKIDANYQAVIQEEIPQGTPVETQHENQEGTAEPIQAEPETIPSTDSDIRATD